MEGTTALAVGLHLSDIKRKIEGELKMALKNRDEVGISTRRMLLSDVHNQEIQNRQALTDDQVVGVLSSSAKKHRDSIAQFSQGGRADLVAKEEAELKVNESYLPEQLSSEAVKKVVAAVVAELKPQGPKDFGKVMQAVMAKVKGQASGALVSRAVKEALS